MNRFRITRSVIPNLFTAMNMFSGFLSIINASQGKYIYASILIIIAAVFDALDGIMARLTKSSSELGVELDSLSDIISFGAAPAYLIYSTYLHSFNAAGIVISSLLLIAGGFRLARFNVQLVGFDKNYFKGLPIPSSAITIAAFVLAYYGSTGFTRPYSDFIIPMVIVLSYLMVSKIRYDTVPKLSIKEIKRKPFAYLFIVASIIILIVTAGKALFYIFVFIILFGIFRHLYYKIFSKS
jgi:CDP-diacylglycerol---serine O-phosphatidyltransferase